MAVISVVSVFIEFEMTIASVEVATTDFTSADGERVVKAAITAVGVAAEEDVVKTLAMLGEAADTIVVKG